MTAEIDLCDAILDILRFIFKKYGAKVRLFRELCKNYFKKNFNGAKIFAVERIEVLFGHLTYPAEFYGTTWTMVPRMLVR